MEKQHIYDPVFIKEVVCHIRLGHGLMAGMKFTTFGKTEAEQLQFAKDVCSYHNLEVVKFELCKTKYKVL